MNEEREIERINKGFIKLINLEVLKIYIWEIVPN